MERKTNIEAHNGQQDLIITRAFALPVELLFKAYAEPEIVAEWMGTNVVKLENRQHGGYRFETSNAKGEIVFSANGSIHEFIPGKQITRTFQMENTPFPAQLEFLSFEKLTDDTSKLTMHIIYKTAAIRDQILQLPFAAGINMAHNRLEETMRQLK